MADKVSNVTFTINSDLKTKADSLFSKLGMDMETALIMFLHKSVRDGEIPFDMAMPPLNAETVVAMCETERITYDPNTKGLNSIEDILQDLDK